MNFDELRKQYKTFIYKSFDITEDKKKIIIKYNFEIPGLAEFNPTTEILKKNIQYKNINDDYIRNIVFNLGMVESISYWKCACPEKVVIECGKLNNEQKDWFRKLYYNGTGEFRYINSIHVSQENFVEFVNSEKAEDRILQENAANTLNGYIIPVGGGKDSVVTLEKLSKNKENNYCLTIGRKRTIYKML